MQERGVGLDCVTHFAPTSIELKLMCSLPEQDMTEQFSSKKLFTVL